MKSHLRLHQIDCPRDHAAIGRIAILLVALLAPLGACAPYKLQGKAIEGDVSFITIVAADDPRLEGPGIPGVQVRLESDPQKLNREVAGDALTDAEGNFSIPFDKVGAGMLLYDVGIQARRKGFSPADSEFSLPPSGKRVLIILEPGVDNANWRSDSELLDQAEKFR